jgi:Domain of unknown function (DUF4157)
VWVYAAAAARRKARIVKTRIPRNVATARRPGRPIPAAMGTAGWAQAEADRARIRSVLRAPPDWKAPATTSVPASTGHKAGRRASAGDNKQRPGSQTKLRISEPGDAYEQEADRTADQVMQAPASQVAMSTATLPTIDRDTRVFPEKRAPQTTSAVSEAALRKAPGIVDQALRSPGQLLDASTRNYFEPRFGLDFGTVRVHTDDAATHSAAAIGARAFTCGSHIVFAAGERPGADRLTAHELTHVAQNLSTGELPVIRRTPAVSPYEIISPVWNVAGRDVVIVQMKADGRKFFFYRRLGKGPKGPFEASYVKEGKWVPLEGFEEIDELGEMAATGRPYERGYRIHKEPYTYAPDVKAGRVQAGYGTQTNKDIAQWLDNELPPGKIKGEVANWSDVQKEFDKHRPRNLPEPGKNAPQKAIERHGEIGEPGGPRSGPSGGGTVEATVEETTERIVTHVPPVPKPKIGFRARLSAVKGGLAAGLKAALSAESIASAAPDVILAIADKVAARDAIKNIETKFAKEGFAKGVAAGVTGWSEAEVDSNLKNLVTPFRVQGLGDPGGLLTIDYILKLAELYENYAVDLGYRFSSAKTLKWKKDMLNKGLADLDRYGYYFAGKPEIYLFEYNFIDKLAWVLRTTTNPIIDEAIAKGEARKALGMLSGAL